MSISSNRWWREAYNLTKPTNEQVERIKRKFELYKEHRMRMAKKEMVNHPSHYGGADNPYEAIKVIEAWDADFNIGTTLRYLCRCGKKTIGGSAEEMRLEDLKKARWYLDREISNIEKQINTEQCMTALEEHLPENVKIDYDEALAYTE